MTELTTDYRSPLVLGRLRPRKNSDSLDEETNASLNNAHLSGNIIVNACLVEKHFNTAIRCHVKSNPTCDGDITFNGKSVFKTGLAVRAALHCKKCNFTTEHNKFYQEATRKGRGRRPAKINTQLAVALTKNAVGPSTFIEILSMCEVMAPSAENLRRSINLAADTFESINQQQLSLNRELVKEEMMSRSNTTSIKIQTDAAYNNSPKGRSFSTPGTQSFAPVFCSEEGLEVPLAVGIASQLCSCPLNDIGQKQHNGSCKLNYSPQKSIANSEFELGKECAKDLVNDNIIPSEIVTDGVGGGALYKGINSVVTENGLRPCSNQDCSKHLSSTLRRNMRKINLTSVYLHDTVVIRQNKQGRLLDFVSKRAIWEFSAIHASTV